MATWQWLILAALISISTSPVIDISFRLNEWALVEGSPLHQWAEGLEKSANEMTQSMLSFQDSHSLWPVVVSLAMLPAVCEEWLFRGTLRSQLLREQQKLSRWHLDLSRFVQCHSHAIFGFLPRLLLGASFGYLVVHSGKHLACHTCSLHQQRLRGVVGLVAWRRFFKLGTGASTLLGLLACRLGHHGGVYLRSFAHPSIHESPWQPSAYMSALRE